MKYIIWVLCLMQLVDASAQQLVLRLEDPQPRLGDSVNLKLELGPLHHQLIDIFNDNGTLAKRIERPDLDNILFKLGANQLGKQTIAAKKLMIHDVVYFTNEIQYEVIDSLPATDHGSWVRAGKLNDSIFWIIIEQRTPRHIKHDANPIEFQTVRLLDRDNTMKLDSIGYKNINYFTISESGDRRFGEKKSFNSFKSIGYYKINNRQKRIVISRDSFAPMPDTVKFTDFVVQEGTQ